MSLVNSMRLMTMLPQLFRTGNLIIKSVEGGVTAEEMAAIVKEIRETIKSIPELGAFSFYLRCVGKSSRGYSSDLLGR